MISLRDRILNAKTKKEIDTLVEEYNNYDSVSVNTKTKVKRAIKQRYNELDEVKPSKKAAKKLKSKKTKK